MSDHNNIALSPYACQIMYSIKKPAMRDTISMQALNHKNVSGV